MGKEFISKIEVKFNYANNCGKCVCLKEVKKSLEKTKARVTEQQNKPISGSHVQVAVVLQEPPRAVVDNFAVSAPISVRAALFNFPVGTVFPQN